MAIILPIEKPRQLALIVVPAVFNVIAVLAVVLRIIARRMANRKLDSSDYTVAVACGFSVVFSGIIIAQAIVGGSGWHLDDLLTSKIFPTRPLHWACYITGIIIAAWSSSTILSALLICQPISALWSLTPEGHCGDEILSFLITGIVNIVTDIIVLTLPLPYLIRLEMELYKKVALTATFTVGLFVCVISALRVRSIQMVDTSDVTFSEAQGLLWSSLEPALGVTVACVPMMRPLFGGKYSKTGTAIMGDYTTKPSVHNKGFRPLGKNSSEYQLRPYGASYNSKVTKSEEIPDNHVEHERDSSITLGVSGK
ncbi:hypothetical protein BX600DRAFT_501111 [Xylariales sp. PMI_506]|nr:hypothetical protein BX600DRAFT_501111 [Xylariales sp. PMI_506]